VPEDMLQYVDIINKISNALKSEIYGPLPHKKYLEDLNKIYLYSLRLKTTINNFLSGSAISNQIDVDDEIIDPFTLIKKFTGAINEKFQSKVKINEQNASELPNIKVNKNTVCDVIKKIFGCIFKLDHETNINISISTDHLGRVVMIFTTTKPVDENILREHLDKAIKIDSLDGQGLIMEVVFSNKNTNAILSIPSYRVVNKKQ
jgi:hypothetical protein